MGSSVFDVTGVENIGKQPGRVEYKSNLKDNLIEFLTFGICETDKCNKLLLCIGIISILMIIAAFVLLGIGISEIVKNKSTAESYGFFYAFIIPGLYTLSLLIKKFVIKKKTQKIS